MTSLLRLHLNYYESFIIKCDFNVANSDGEVGRTEHWHMMDGMQRIGTENDFQTWRMATENRT